MIIIDNINSGLSGLPEKPSEAKISSVNNPYEGLTIEEFIEMKRE